MSQHYQSCILNFGLTINVELILYTHHVQSRYALSVLATDAVIILVQAPETEGSLIYSIFPKGNNKITIIG